jgi:hypothetical protein
VFDGLASVPPGKAAAELNARGIVTPEGAKWHATQVIRVRKRLGQWKPKPSRFAQRPAVEAKRADNRPIDITQTIQELQAAGATSLRHIADALNRRAIPTTRGGRWSAVLVSRVLSRRANRISPAKSIALMGAIGSVRGGRTRQGPRAALGTLAPEVERASLATCSARQLKGYSDSTSTGGATLRFSREPALRPCLLITIRAA